VERKTVKFVEALWRFIFYTTFSVVGYYALFVPTAAPWIGDTMQFYVDWPVHPMSAAMLFYYHVELGAYFHQLFWTEVNRSDAAEMILHHFITIALMITSYLSNFTRLGATILFIHDLSDIVLESAKCFNYTALAKGNAWMQPFVDILFGLFMVVFFVTRLVVFPRQILYSILFEAWELYGGCVFGGCYVFLGGLIGLQCLHIFWFYLIARMAYKLLVVGKVEKDVREEDDGEVADEYSAEEDYAHSAAAEAAVQADKETKKVK
jgi:hypothetical protein